MKKAIGSVAIVIPLIFCAAVFYLSRQDPASVAQPLGQGPLGQADAQSPPGAQAKPAIRYPIPEDKDPQLASKPLPPLNESDQSVKEALSGSLVLQPLKELFRLDDIVRNIVVTIDNLPRQTMAVRQYPVTPAGGEFLATGAGESLSIAAENARRYTPYVRIAENVNVKSLVAAYVHLYPLFERAYQDLGYPDGHFNDRLVMVIDHLLNTPELEGPITLVQPHVLYRFADSRLEADSAGHKIMVRMGRENAAIVKDKLREIRRELTRNISQK